MLWTVSFKKFIMADFCCYTTSMFFFGEMLSFEYLEFKAPCSLLC